MTAKKDFAERRKHKRFKAREGVFAILASDTDKLNPIKDISRGGLAFQYIDNGKSPDGSVEFEILSPADGFYLKKVPAKIVVDVESDNTVSLSSLPMRRVNVQFGKMTPIQSRLLEYFIKNCNNT